MKDYKTQTTGRTKFLVIRRLNELQAALLLAGWVGGWVDGDLRDIPFGEVLDRAIRNGIDLRIFVGGDDCSSGQPS